MGQLLPWIAESGGVNSALQHVSILPTDNNCWSPTGAEARKAAVLTCRFKSGDERSLASSSRDYCQPTYNNDHGCGPRATLIQHKHRLLQKRQRLSLPTFILPARASNYQQTLPKQILSHSLPKMGSFSAGSASSSSWWCSRVGDGIRPCKYTGQKWQAGGEITLISRILCFSKLRLLLALHNEGFWLFFLLLCFFPAFPLRHISDMEMTLSIMIQSKYFNSTKPMPFA